MTVSADPQMRGFTPTTERTWDSNVLGRRIMLNKVWGMSDDDLKALRLELQEASASIRDQLDEHGSESDPDWFRRARSKQRHTQLFVVACGEEAERRLAAMQLERDRLKTIRTLQDQDRNRRKSAKVSRVVHGLLLEEWGPERTRAFYDKASAMADALLAAAAEKDAPAAA